MAGACDVLYLVLVNSRLPHVNLSAKSVKFISQVRLPVPRHGEAPKEATIHGIMIYRFIQVD